jgi:preprotein translocase subunit YajC
MRRHGGGWPIPQWPLTKEDPFMFITPAFAQDGAGGASGALIQLVPFLLIFVILYFMIIRPQQKRVKEHRDMIAAIRRNDVVVTSGGIIGKVVRVTNDTELRLEIADGVQIRVVKGTIAEVRSKTEPVREKPKPQEEEEDEDEDDTDGGNLIDDYLDRDEPARAPSKSTPSVPSASSGGPRKASSAALPETRRQGVKPLGKPKPKTKAQVAEAPARADGPAAAAASRKEAGGAKQAASRSKTNGGQSGTGVSNGAGASGASGAGKDDAGTPAGANQTQTGKTDN